MCVCAVNGCVCSRGCGEYLVVGINKVLVVGVAAKILSLKCQLACVRCGGPPHGVLT